MVFETELTKRMKEYGRKYGYKIEETDIEVIARKLNGTILVNPQRCASSYLGLYYVCGDLTFDDFARGLIEHEHLHNYLADLGLESISPESNIVQDLIISEYLAIQGFKLPYCELQRHCELLDFDRYAFMVAFEDDERRRLAFARAMLDLPKSEFTERGLYSCAELKDLTFFMAVELLRDEIYKLRSDYDRAKFLVNECLREIEKYARKVLERGL